MTDAPDLDGQESLLPADPAPDDATTDPTATPPAAGKAPRTRKRTAGKARPRDAAPKAPRGPGRPSTRETRERKLGENLTSIGMLVAVAVNPADGMAVVEHAPSIAEAFAKLADENARVARLLDASMEGSAWFGVVASVGGLVLAIAANHGAAPGALLAGAGDAASVAGTGTPTADELAAMFGAGMAGPPPPPAAGG